MRKVKEKITEASQLSKKLICDPIDKEWKDSLKSFWWATNTTVSLDEAIGVDKEQHPIYFHETKEHLEKLLNLRTKILSFGGEEVCLPYIEDDLDLILHDSQFWYGDHAIFKKGIPSRCHQNIACYFLNNPEKMKICTGYALSDDGMWRQHTWGLRTYKTKDDVIIESTVPRVAYYGTVLSTEDAHKFANEVLY